MKILYVIKLQHNKLHWKITIMISDEVNDYENNKVKMKQSH